MTQSNDMPDIKPCPCCRNKAELRTKHPDYFGAGDWTKPTFKIKCTVCPITTGWVRDEAKLIVGWNTRADLTPPQSPNRAVLDAAQAVIDRWETPLWKDVPATAGYIHALRDAIAAANQADEVKGIAAPTPEQTEIDLDKLAEELIPFDDLCYVNKESVKSILGMLSATGRLKV